MIPSIISRQVTQGIQDYLRTSFPPAEPFFSSVLEDLVTSGEDLFRGPFLTLKLPFRPGKRSDGHFEDLPMRFAPYRHQERAFERLSGDSPKSTLVATGTGSGKTECFLYPLLDYCHRHRGEDGVKAIIVYPMNALATDQARRIAKMIHENDALNGNVSAGLFIGGLDQDAGQDRMTPDMVITDNDSLRKRPPDILLTNYKMLDYLLLRPRDYKLWEHNGPDTLKYVVIDELHTFDGAQGTDLACLLRRLMDRLKAPRESMCFVGTSATLGEGEGAEDDLCNFANSLFGVPFTGDAIIKEDLLTHGEFLDDAEMEYIEHPGQDSIEDMLPGNFDTLDGYIRAQCRLWFAGWSPEGPLDEAFRLGLGKRLKEHLVFQNLIRLLRGETADLNALLEKLGKFLSGLSESEPHFKNAMIDSIMALISSAKRAITRNDGVQVVEPFLNVRVQLWLKELRRLVTSVTNEPRMRFADDLSADEPIKHLPQLHCRSCERMGWLSWMPQSDLTLNADLSQIYSKFFSNSPTVQMIFPASDSTVVENEQQEIGNIEILCGSCLGLHRAEGVTACKHCGDKDNLIKVERHNPRTRKGNGRVLVEKNCPYCGDRDALTVMGSRSPSLISVAIGQLFASAYNSDRKLLAFSDSVQDASHRASFFGGRTYRLNLRTAIQQVIDSQSAPVTVASLPALFRDYWLDKLDDSEKYCAQFIAPDMQWLADADNVVEMVNKRVHWDILHEFGFGSRIGRTLEKSGCAIAHLDPKVLDTWANALLPQLNEHIGVLRDLTLLDVKRFLIGVINMCKTRGGIDADFLSPYLEQNGNTYIFNILDYLPSMYQRAPAFIYHGADSPSRFDKFVGSGSTKTIYQRWLLRAFANKIEGDLLPYSGDIFTRLLTTALDASVFVERDARNGKVYGIDPHSLVIDTEVDQYSCSSTGYTLSAPRSESEYWEGMASLRYDVDSGVLRHKEQAVDFYGELYKTGRVERAVPREHTGLLEREAREELEQQFIHGNGAPAPNILSCTPTLEMGINIGDLSTVVLCSVPPDQAKYIQRIGRAGRRDGNAFNLVVAMARPHDLHFYESPELMISGDVGTPGIFLNAPVVLERQLMAFCFDRWIQDVKGDTSVIPRRIKDVIDQLGKAGAKDRFPNNFMTYLELNRTKLLDDFLVLFEGDITDATVAYLQDTMAPDTHLEGRLENAIINRLTGIKKERDALRDRVKRIKTKMKKNEANPARDEKTEKELDDLKREMSALDRLIRDIHAKRTYNFFTDEGLLPNYAFPEAGVSLRSVIYRLRKQEEGKGKYDTWTHEYERPAKTAIQELAPGNAFYVDGRRLVIDQVDLSVSKPEQWRFCGECSHAEPFLPSETPAAACPSCGSRSWADKAMVRSLIKMRQVVATSSDRASRIHDDKDDRDPLFFNKHMLMETEDQFIDQAFTLEDQARPFGFEYIRKATFRDVNFGSKDYLETESIEIAGNQVSRQGFRLCGKCGKVVNENRPKDFKHAIDCPHYGKGDEAGIIDALYMYRQFESEYIRILLPMADTDIQSKLPSFIASLHMGLAAKFKGDVSHLQVMTADEPVQGSMIRKRYLILYDQVPGGTGYLKELMKNPESLLELLEVAYEKLRGCGCQNEPGKDGCYGCLYAYRVSRDLPDISRQQALELLGDILKGKNKLKQIKSIEEIGVNSLFESQLEMQFIEALRRSNSEKCPIRVREKVVRTKPGYYLEIDGKGYEIELQAELGPGEGVEVKSRVDFIIHPLRSSKAKPIAVFTDGFLWHAEANDYRLPKDLQQRMAIIRSGKYHCWSLSYNDVQTRFNGDKTGYWLPYHHGNIDPLISAYEANHDIKAIKGAIKENAFDSLLTYLSNPNVQDWRLLAFLYSLSLSERGFTTNAIHTRAKAALLALDDEYKDINADLAQHSGQEVFWCGQTISEADGFHRASLASFGDPSRVRKNDIHSLGLTIRFEDDVPDHGSPVFKKAWNGLLQAANIAQFLPEATFVTTKFLADGLGIPAQPDFFAIEEEPNEASAPQDEEKYNRIRDLLSGDYDAIVDYAMDLGLPIPEPGYELYNDDEMILGEAEFAWHETKLALLVPDEPIEPFEAAGWTVVPIDDIKSKDALKGAYDKAGETNG